MRALGSTTPKSTNTMRDKQRAAADALPGVHDICIMDAGDKLNITCGKSVPWASGLPCCPEIRLRGERPAG